MTDGRRFFVPEVVQTSGMDCGPAALKALLEGYGIHASYGRLREACQTSVDGTSISSIDALANRLGLEAEEVMLPPDALLSDDVGALPALLVVRLPNGLTHFIVVWRKHGGWVQLMDPALGRRWVHRNQLLRDIYVHTIAVPAADFRKYATGDEFTLPLRKRLQRLGLADRAEALLARARADPSWRALAALDAAARMGEALRKPSGLSRSRLAALVGATFAEALDRRGGIPEEFWQVNPAAVEGGEEQVLLTGAVLLRIKGRRPSALLGELPRELAAALQEKPARPAMELLRLLFSRGAPEVLLLLFTLALLACGTILEALLLRGVIDIGRDLGLLQQRWAAMGMLVAFLLLMAALDFPMTSSAQRLARRLEVSLRTAFLEKIPRLGDRYLTSRPISDMAERSHGIHHLREVPDMARRFVRASLEIIVTAAGLAWLDPRTAPLAILTALAGIGVPLLLQPQLIEREHRARVHTGALARFNLDALLGLTAIRAHGAERSMRREHESLLVEWACAARAVVAFAVAAEGAEIFFGLLISGAMLADYLPRAGDGGGMLLYAYWTMNLPILGQQIAAVTRQYPMKRNLTLRLLEPLAALEEPEPPAADGPEPRVRSAGARIVIEGVTVVASGHTLLRDIDLQLQAGSHVAVVGASGAGKSSLLGLLLGWHRPAQGCVLVDGAELLGRRQDELRGDSAWVDPAVHLWNRTLLTNLRYGSRPSATSLPLAQVLEDADLLRVIENLPEGLQTPLGEGGGLLSGGEGQRVRLGRALFRAQARLVVLDEPFRGLDRPRRSELLGRVRRHFASATMLCVTHDVSETLRFERVLVVEDGRIAEDGAPADLAAQPGSRYRRMLDAEEELRNGLFAGERFRRIWLEGRTLREEGN